MGETCPWSAFDPGTIAFCERRLCAWIVEPSNAWSNLAFLAAGIVILMKSRAFAPSPLPLIGLSALLVGIGSFAFHATGTFVGEVLDVSAMFLISGLFIVLNVRRLYDPPLARLVALYGGLTAVSVALLVTMRDVGILVFALQLTVAGILEIILFVRQRRETRYRDLLLLVLTFAVSLTIWRLDFKHRVCDPDNHWITGHAVWHVLNALCLYFVFRFHGQFVATRPRASARDGAR